MLEPAVTVTVILFLVGIAFYGGVLAQRVKAIEDWRKETRQELHDMRKEFREGLAELKRLLLERHA